MNKTNNPKPEYKHTSLGWIPKDWAILEFGMFVALSNKKYVPTPLQDLKCIELENINQETGSINGFILSSQQKSTKNVFTKGQILFGKLRPYLKKYWLAEFDGVCSSEIWVLQPNPENCSNDFLFRLVQQHQFIQIANVSSGSKLPRSDWDFIVGFPFSLPTLSEQFEINKILSSWDVAITQTQQLFVQLQQRNKGLSQNLLTGRKRLPGFSNKWKTEALKNLAKEINIRNKQGLETSSLYGVTKKNGLVPMRDHVKGESFENCKIVRSNWFAYNPMRINIGSIGFWTDLEEIMVSGDYVVFACNEDKLLPQYLDFIRETILWENFMQAAGNGSVRIRIYFKELGQFIFPCPGIEEQKQIIKIITAAKKELELCLRKLSALQQQKKGLMQKLLTGQIRVKL